MTLWLLGIRVHVWDVLTVSNHVLLNNPLRVTIILSLLTLLIDEKGSIWSQT